VVLLRVPVVVAETTRVDERVDEPVALEAEELGTLVGAGALAKSSVDWYVVHWEDAGTLAV
jgi:hypothetical protein